MDPIRAADRALSQAASAAVARSGCFTSLGLTSDVRDPCSLPHSSQLALEPSGLLPSQGLVDTFLLDPHELLFLLRYHVQSHLKKAFSDYLSLKEDLLCISLFQHLLFFWTYTIVYNDLIYLVVWYNIISLRIFVSFAFLLPRKCLAHDRCTINTVFVEWMNEWTNYSRFTTVWVSQKVLLVMFPFR